MTPIRKWEYTWVAEYVPLVVVWLVLISLFPVRVLVVYLVPLDDDKLPRWLSKIYDFWRFE